MRPSLIHDLFAYNDWANEKILAMSDGLSDGQLDASQPMGFGSLRATLHHLAFAERLWLDRWLSKPWAPLSMDSAHCSLPFLANTFRTVAKERNELLDAESHDNFSRMIAYRNTAEQYFKHRLRELLVHVANHATYHRAQALNFLRGCNVTIVGGLDYLFFKMARPTVPNDSGAIAAMHQRGIELSAAIHPEPIFDVDVVRRYCLYGDWAMETVLNLAAALSDQDLDQSFDIGVGSLRKTLHHICEAEQWWYGNWTRGPSEFARLPPDLTMAAFVETYRTTARQRNDWLNNKSAQDLARQVTANPGGESIHFRLGESLIQLCGHGTHHRAQCVNMLRRLGHTPPAIDYVVWIRGVDAPSD